MFLSNDAIQEYRQIFSKHFGKEITFEQARRQGEDLIQLMKILYFDDDINCEDTRISHREDGEKICH